MFLKVKRNPIKMVRGVRAENVNHFYVQNGGDLAFNIVRTMKRNGIEVNIELGTGADIVTKDDLEKLVRIFTRRAEENRNAPVLYWYSMGRAMAITRAMQCVKTRNYTCQNTLSEVRSMITQSTVNKMYKEDSKKPMSVIERIRIRRIHREAMEMKERA